MDKPVIALIQARMGSSRLPGKVLKPLLGEPILYHILARVRHALCIDDVGIVTTENPEDDVIRDFCKAHDVFCYRGNEQDVLDRYFQAAQKLGGPDIVRITSDCPLIDPEIIDTLVESFQTNHPDYASNIMERGYPRGLDAEIMSFQSLQRAWENAKEPFEREHVTPYIYRHPDQFQCISQTPTKTNPEWPHYRWTVDTPEDFELVEKIYNYFGNDLFSWQDALHLMKEQPELSQINAHIEQKKL